MDSWTSWSCFISTLLTLDLWGFSSSIANGRPADQCRPGKSNINLRQSRALETNLTISKGPDVHVLPAGGGEVKTWNRRVGLRSSWEKCSRSSFQDSPSALKVARMGAAINSSTDDSILLCPSITHGVCGRLRQNLLYLPSTVRTSARMLVVTKHTNTSCLNCSYLQWRERHGDTGRPVGHSVWTAVPEVTDNACNTIIIIAIDTFKRFDKEKLVPTLKMQNRKSCPELWPPPSVWTPTAHAHTHTKTRTWCFCFLFNVKIKSSSDNYFFFSNLWIFFY